MSDVRRSKSDGHCARTIDSRARRALACRAYTLIEILMVVTILGIAAAMAMPSLGSTDILKAQGALRSIVSDITFAQSDAVAMQEKRAIVFDVPNSSYSLVQVPGNAIDAAANTMYDPTRPGGRWVVSFPTDSRFGDTRITSADFGGGATALVFDGMGGPIADAGSNNPGPGGTIHVTGAHASWTITVEAFTGRVTVAQDHTGG
jgi:prepilin-type N-terminal cleavage/methylation domain-containing protein